MILPGLIDIHVHLRDPGETHKEDFYTGTCAALAGGVTAVFDMPNNSNPIFSQKALYEKIHIAKGKAVCDWGLYFGTDGKNTQEFEQIFDKVVGLKVYLTESTGKYFIEDPHLLDTVFAAWPNRKPIVVHAEREKVDQALDLGEKHKQRVHITHVAHQEMLEKIIDARKSGLDVTCDVTPHHLFLTREYVEKNSGLGRVKPALASQKDVDFLWDHIADIDCIATDHAPHTKEEKLSESPPSGFPGLETMLPLLLTAVREGRLSLDDVIRLTNTNPQKIFGISQGKDTYIEVDADEKDTIENADLKTKCGWSPFSGWEVQGRVKNVFIRGQKVFSEGKVLGKSGFGEHVIN